MTVMEFLQQHNYTEMYKIHLEEHIRTNDIFLCLFDKSFTFSFVVYRNHQFDASDRVRGKQKRKKGDVSNPDEPARGIQPVRQHHRRDETKILPHVRRGLNFADFES